MQHSGQFDDNTIKTHSKIIWIGLLCSNLILAGVIFMIENFVKMAPFLPDQKMIFIGLCIFSVPLSFLLLSRFKQSERKIRDNIHSGMGNEQSALQNYIQWMIFGTSMSGMPAIFGLILYLASGEIVLSLFFIFVSFVCGFLYKPSL